MEGSVPTGPPAITTGPSFSTRIVVLMLSITNVFLNPEVCFFDPGEEGRKGALHLGSSAITTRPSFNSKIEVLMFPIRNVFFDPVDTQASKRASKQFFYMTVLYEKENES